MSPFFPVDKNNALQAPGWYPIVGIFLAAWITFFVLNRKKKKESREKEESRKKIDITSNILETLKRIVKRSPSTDNTFSVPRTKKKQTELAASLLGNISACVSLANGATNLSLFTDWYDEALDGFSKLMQFKKVKFKSPPAYDYYKLKDEFQLHLCDAIVRTKENTISEINGKFKNSREFQIRTLESFENDVNRVRSRFSTGTAALADESIQEIKKMLKISTVPPVLDTFELQTVDRMDGHAFEFWCAELLKKNGFENVEVTPGSGDQGVDVLAEKDGIKYAIQCKCYSSDLGNAPVQEVTAGKMVYNCQIGAVMTNRYFTKGAMDAAAATGVLLWDREKLQQMISATNM